MTIALDLRLLPAVATAAGIAGRAAGLSRHAWITTVLDLAAGVVDPEATKTPHPLERGRTYSARVKLRLVDERYSAYSLAAERARMPIAQWAATIVGIATNESELPTQIARLA